LLEILLQIKNNRFFVILHILRVYSGCRSLSKILFPNKQKQQNCTSTIFILENTHSLSQWRPSVLYKSKRNIHIKSAISAQTGSNLMPNNEDYELKLHPILAETTDFISANTNNARRC
jgi:hypothetical protein